jgi:hypothetical protein
MCCGQRLGARHGLFERFSRRWERGLEPPVRPPASYRPSLWNKCRSTRLFLSNWKFPDAVSPVDGLYFQLHSGGRPCRGAAWQRFVVPTTGTNVEIPVTIFSKDAELPEGGTGRRFYTDDRRANLTVQSVAIPLTTRRPHFLRRRIRRQASCTKG